MSNARTRKHRRESIAANAEHAHALSEHWRTNPLMCEPVPLQRRQFTPETRVARRWNGSDWVPDAAPVDQDIRRESPESADDYAIGMNRAYSRTSAQAPREWFYESPERSRETVRPKPIGKRQKMAQGADDVDTWSKKG